MNYLIKTKSSSRSPNSHIALPRVPKFKGLKVCIFLKELFMILHCAPQLLRECLFHVFLKLTANCSQNDKGIS